MTETNWIIFTGAASAGKSTIISYLEKEGYKVKGEMVREYLFEIYGDNIPLEKIPWDSLSFQTELLNRKIEREKALNPTDLIIFDRGIYDSYAYSYLQSIDLNKLYVEHPYRYKAVFLFERLPVVHDNLRRETNEQLIAQENVTICTYEHFGYDIIRVPVFSTQKNICILKRLSYIKNKINTLFQY